MTGKVASLCSAEGWNEAFKPTFVTAQLMHKFPPLKFNSKIFFELSRYPGCRAEGCEAGGEESKEWKNETDSEWTTQPPLSLYLVPYRWKDCVEDWGMLH